MQKSRMLLSGFKALRISARHATTFSSRHASSALNIKVDESTNDLRKPRLVIFDKDGTLICFHTMWIPWATNTVDRIRKSTGLSLRKEILDVLGFCPTGQKVMPGLLAEGTMSQIHGALVQLLIERNVKLSTANALVDHCVSDSYTRCVSSLRELVDLTELFVTLRSFDMKIAVCTADNRDSTMSMLRHTGVEKFVDDIMCGDDNGSMPKPHPHNALAICQRLDVDPEEAIMVGDTVADMGLARSAGLAGAVGVLSGVGSRSYLQPHADILVDHVGHLVDLFSKP